MAQWRDEAAEIRTKAHYEILRVLVFGPGSPTDLDSQKTKAYEKRLQIKRVLKESFPRSEVHFPEDQEMIEIAEGIHGQLRKEAVLARSAHMVLMLDTSRGADLELDHFVPTYPWFRDKVHVFLHEKYLGTTGLASEVFKWLHSDQVEGFTDEEFESCTLATEKAVKAAEVFAIDVYLRTR